MYSGAYTEERRPRRSICSSCAKTHVLLCEDTLVRRQHKVEVMGAALVAYGAGRSKRSIALGRGLARSTVRSWISRFSEMADAVRQHFTAWAAALDPGHGPFPVSPSAFSDALEAIGVVGIVAVRRFGPRPVWSLASVLTQGCLLATRACHYRRPA